MKYRKGEYILVPNKESMRGLPTPTQLVWMWLCSYADGYGQCWPSRTRLAKDTCLSVKTIDRHLKRLELLGWVEKTKRWENDKQKSNLYQLNLVPSAKEKQGGLKVAPTKRGGTQVPYRGDTNDILTKPIELNKEKQLSDEEIANRRKLITEKLRNRFVS